VLRGLAQAGSEGAQEAQVFALALEGGQIRIAAKAAAEGELRRVRKGSPFIAG